MLPPPKHGLHPRNRHKEGYDFRLLTRTCPELEPFVHLNAYQNESIDFANPEAVKALNKALLRHFYGIEDWDIPVGYLCPPIPGRADYLHQLADLLGSCNDGVIPRGASIRALDIGVGANCVYPLLGHAEYGWRFLGSDIDPVALASAEGILRANPGLAGAIELRRQAAPANVFQGLVQSGETFAVSLCNPPFHTSAEAAREGSHQKWTKLRKGASTAKAPLLNFGGQGTELWCPGGEEAFVRRMVRESAQLPTLCFWFSTLVSKAASLPSVYRALRQAGALETRTIDMAQGQKRSRLVAWTFLDATQREAWRLTWGNHHK